jgi:DNA repair exonuclease SbcCD ATPase subunit
MIIKALAAQDFRKYASLQLDNLPERGLLAVIGGNESGKSTLGDAIQFGLFGSSNQMETSEAARLIRWGCEQATVTLRLLLRGHEYRLTRSVNRQGDVMATLFSTEESVTLADTPEGVAAQLKSLLGYNQKSFGQAFYWSQQSSHSPQDDADSLLSLAGLQEYAQLCEQLQAENIERVSEIAIRQMQREETQAGLEALQIDDAHLPHLESMGSALETRQQHFLQLAQRIDKETEQYAANHEPFQALREHASRLGFWTRVSLILFMLMLLTGLFLLFAPALGSQLLAGMNNWMREMLGQATIRIAALLALGGAGLLVYGWYVDMRRINPLRKQAGHLADALLDGLAVNDTPAVEQVDGNVAAYLYETEMDMPERSSGHPDIAVIPEWAKEVHGYQTSPQNIQAAADALNVSMESRNREFGGYLQHVQNAIRAEQDRLEMRGQMQASLARQGEELEQEQHQQVVTDLAVGLLQRNGSNAVSRFNQLVQQRCSELVEQFTGGHYRQLELMADFSLRVFSSEKDDYLDFAETSTGTQRQIALAMRVAVANALADSTHTPAQMLFLDEPLAFFDPERTGNTLKNLEENTHGAVCQIWLTAQVLPGGASFAKVIDCPSQGDTLAV